MREIPTGLPMDILSDDKAPSEEGKTGDFQALAALLSLFWDVLLYVAFFCLFGLSVAKTGIAMYENAYLVGFSWFLVAFLGLFLIVRHWLRFEGSGG